MGAHTAEEAGRRLRSAAADGGLAALVERHDLDLVVLFGSVLFAPSRARSLDVGVRARDRERFDVLGVWEGLADLAGTTMVDLMDLGRAGPVAREQALVHVELLFERSPGLRADAQITATTKRMDSACSPGLSLGPVRSCGRTTGPRAPERVPPRNPACGAKGHLDLTWHRSTLDSLE